VWRVFPRKQMDSTSARVAEPRSAGWWSTRAVCFGAAGVLAVWFLCGGSPDYPALPSGGETVLPSSQVEEWVEKARAAGAGIVRIPASGDAPAREVVVDASRSLSSDGQAMLDSHIQRSLHRMEKKITECLSSVTGSDSKESYRQQLLLLDEYEQMRAIQDLFRRGCYFVFENGQNAPVAPPGSRAVTISPFPIEGGVFGLACFFIGVDGRKEMADVALAIDAVTQDLSEERVRAFNALPEQDRRQWTSRFQRMQEALAKGDYHTMPPADIREFLKIRRDLEDMRIEVDFAYSVMMAR